MFGEKEEYAYCGMFTNEWRNPPAPFNPDARPYADQLRSDTTAALEAEGAYKHFTLKERQDLNLWRDMYELLRPPYEKQFQNMTANAAIIAYT